MYCNFEPGSQCLGSSGKRGIGMCVCKPQVKCSRSQFSWVFIQWATLGTDFSGWIRSSPHWLCLPQPIWDWRARHQWTYSAIWAYYSGRLLSSAHCWGFWYASSWLGAGTVICTRRPLHPQICQWCSGPLHRHVLEATRFRQGDQAHTLDLVFTNEAGMVKNLQYCPGLGSSDHIVLRFDLACYTVRHESQDSRPNFNWADFEKLNSLICDGDIDLTVAGGPKCEPGGEVHFLQDCTKLQIQEEKPVYKSSCYETEEEKESSLARIQALSGPNLLCPVCEMPQWSS